MDTINTNTTILKVGEPFQGQSKYIPQTPMQKEYVILNIFSYHAWNNSAMCHVMETGTGHKSVVIVAMQKFETPTNPYGETIVRT